MPYFVVKGEPVFLYTTLFEQVKQKSLQHKGADFRVSSMFEGTREAKEADKLMYEHLEHEFERDPVYFHSEFINFDLKDRDAKENIWDFLYDYCFYHRCGYLSDRRNDFGKILADFAGESYTHPMGKTFVLNLFEPANNFWRKFTNRMKRRVQKFPIQVENIDRIVGNLKSSIVYSKDFEMALSNKFNVTLKLKK